MISPKSGRSCLSVAYSRFESQCELVGARSIFVAASDAFELVNHVLGLHPFYQRCDTLQIAMTSANEIDVFYDSVFDFNIYQPRTGPKG